MYATETMPWIAQRFADPDRAKPIMDAINCDINRYSGKWNYHFSFIRDEEDHFQAQVAAWQRDFELLMTWGQDA